MTNKTKMRIAALAGSFIFLTGCTKIDIPRNEERTQIEELNEEIARINDSPKFEFHYYNDTTDVNKEVEELGITDDSILPYGSYKPMQYIDMNGLERIAVTEAFVDYLTDENGNVIGKTFTYRDVFNGRVLLTTTDDLSDHIHHRIENFESDEVYYIMYQSDDLLDLRKIVIDKGLSEEYVRVIMSDNIRGKGLTRREVGEMYVLLVASNNRTNFYDSHTHTLK